MKDKLNSTALQLLIALQVSADVLPTAAELEAFPDFRQSVDDNLKAMLSTGRDPNLFDVDGLGFLVRQVIVSLRRGMVVDKTSVIESCLYSRGLTPNNWDAYFRLVMEHINALATESQRDTDLAEEKYGSDSDEFEEARRNQIIQPVIDGIRYVGKLHAIEEKLGSAAVDNYITRRMTAAQTSTHRAQRLRDEAAQCRNKEKRKSTTPKKPTESGEDT